MKILVLQHIPIEDPGYIKVLMQQDQYELTTIELDAGEKIPNNLAEFDAMLCMGGPMDTWMEAEYPWLIEEKIKLKEFVCDLEKPFLGFCLGAQLLGEVLGGKVVKSNPPEIGVLDIHLQPASKNDVLFHNFPATIKSVQWHSYEVQGLAENLQVEILASSPTTTYQAFRYKQNAYGIQYHIEVKESTVQEWGAVPEYKQALIDTLGEKALPELDRLAKECMGDMNANCKKLYENFKCLIAK